LHVTTAGKPTNGCIAVAQPALASILRWLKPSANPRILIGLS
jgi:L,D-peptidoglycan transpeptidase YkuD (ErfK/YbiS/YcfS/YnhG family)